MNQHNPPQSYGHYTGPPPSRREMLAPYKKPLRRWANIIGFGLLLSNVLMLLISFIFMLIFIPLQENMGVAASNIYDQGAQMIAYILGLWLPTILIVSWIKIPGRVAFPMRKPPARIVVPAVCITLGTNLIGSICVSMLSLFLENTFGLIPSMPEFALPEGLVANILFTVNIAVLPAIFEELMFRGVVLQTLRRFGDGFALVTSSILFGMMHGNLLQGPNAFLQGLVIGFFVLQTGSLLTGMTMHLVNNGLVILTMYLTELLPTAQAELVNVIMVFAYAVLGALSLLFLVVTAQGSFKLHASDYPLSGGSKYFNFFITIGQLLFLAATIYLTSFYV